jgi:hypothetical protein
MLSGVLLQMVEPSQPINLAVNGIANLGDWSLEQMQNPGVVGVDAIHDSRVAE